jgi:adenylosuccinate lyase
VAEAAEPFGRGQKGSSAMPHKRNPIVCERVCGLARVVRNNTGVAFENQALWHERDISHSSAERVILADSFCLIDYILERMTRVVSGLTVDEARMASNLASSRGLIHSSTILSALLRAGVERGPAYQWIQAASMKVLDEGGTLLERLVATPFPGGGPSPLGRKELEALCGHGGLLGNVKGIFDRLGLN